MRGRPSVITLPPSLLKEPRPQIATPNRLSAPRRKATDHLANERTFLAWIRTALAVSTFEAALGRLRGLVHLHHLSVPGTVLLTILSCLMAGVMALDLRSS